MGSRPRASSRKPRHSKKDDDALPFEATTQDGEVRRELRVGDRLTISPYFTQRIALLLDHPTRTPPCYLVKETPGRDILTAYDIYQPEVQFNGRGRVRLPGDRGASIELGREASPELVLGPDVAPLQCTIEIGPDWYIDIIGRADTPTVVIMHEREIATDPPRLHLSGTQRSSSED